MMKQTQYVGFQGFPLGNNSEMLRFSQTDSETAVSGELHTTMNSIKKPFINHTKIRASNNETQFSVNVQQFQKTEEDQVNLGEV
jgi:hypothetical protein